MLVYDILLRHGTLLPPLNARIHLVLFSDDLARPMLMRVVEISEMRVRLLQELSRAVKLENTTVLHHRNLVEIYNSIQSMGDNNDSTSLQFDLNKLLDNLVGDTVETVRTKSDQLTFITGSADDKPAGRLVHYDDWTFP
jgi:hypothetical protein